MTAFVTTAQNGERYNIEGDKALEILDYSAAKVWFEEGVTRDCDPYSIGKLTTIWIAEESMHVIMRGLMNQCLTCLEKRADSYKDTTSINLLISYYTEGIGTEKNLSRAAMWQAQLDEIRNPSQGQPEQYGIIPPRGKTKMEFFAGYAASYYAPYGLTVGGVGRSVGWYLRFRTNLSFYSFTEEYKNGSFTGDNSFLYRFSDAKEDKKVNAFIASGGLVVKAAPSFLISAGVGYCSREYLRKAVIIDNVEAEERGAFWAKYEGKNGGKPQSFSGIALDLDGTFKIGKSVYGSLGISVLQFYYVSANAGIGMFF